jgi:competence protein ComEA
VAHPLRPRRTEIPRASLAVVRVRAAYSAFALAAVDLNTASKAELEALNGVGPVKAQAIVDYREANGPFKSQERINDVKGIGGATFETIKGDITLTGASRMPAAPPAPAPAALKAEAPTVAPAAPAPAPAKAETPKTAPTAAPATAAAKAEAKKAEPAREKAAKDERPAKEEKAATEKAAKGDKAAKEKAAKEGKAAKGKAGKEEKAKQ